MNLSYTGFCQYFECPKAFWYRYVQERKKTTEPYKYRVHVGAGKGLLFDMVLQRFYGANLWKHPEPEATALLLSVLPDIMREDFNARFVQKIYYHPDQLESDTAALIPSAVALVYKEGLNKPARCEVELTRGKLFGRCDLLFEDGTLLDSKVVKNPDQLDGLQLQWYAMLNPEVKRVGYALWAQGRIDWHPLRETASLREKAQKIQVWSESKVTSDQYPANPGEKCIRCSYLSRCTEGKSWKTP